MSKQISKLEQRLVIPSLFFSLILSSSSAAINNDGLHALVYINCAVDVNMYRWLLADIIEKGKTHLYSNDPRFYFDLETVSYLENISRYFYTKAIRLSNEGHYEDISKLRIHDIKSKLESETLVQIEEIADNAGKCLDLINSELPDIVNGGEGL